MTTLPLSPDGPRAPVRTRPNGRPRTVDGDGREPRADGGALAGMIGATGVAQPEPRGEAPGRRYQELLDFVPDALVLTDERGVIREASHAVSALVGFARAYAINKPLTAFIHADSIVTLATALERLRGSEDGRIHTFAMRLKGRRSGPPREILARATPVRAESGALIGLRWSLRDVTEETARTLALAGIQQDHARELRTRTMELEAIARMQAATIAHHERALASAAKIAADAAKALHHGAEPRALLAHVLAGLAEVCGGETGGSGGEA